MDKAAEERAAKLKEETVRYRRSVLDVNELAAEGELGDSAVGRPMSISVSG